MMVDTVGARIASHNFRNKLKEYEQNKPKKQETENRGLLQRTKMSSDKPKEDTFLYDLALSIRNS